MSGRIIPIDPLADQRWEHFVGAHPLAHFCHTSAWLEVLRRSFGYQPAHLAYEQNGQVLGVLPLMAIRSRFTGRRLVSLPFSGPAGPLGDAPDARRPLRLPEPADSRDPPGAQLGRDVDDPALRLLSGRPGRRSVGRLASNP